MRSGRWMAMGTIKIELQAKERAVRLSGSQLVSPALGQNGARPASLELARTGDWAFPGFNHGIASVRCEDTGAGGHLLHRRDEKLKQSHRGG